MTEALDNAEDALGDWLADRGMSDLQAGTRLYDALRALVTEHRRLLADMHQRELHHFEEEQARERAEAERDRALAELDEAHAHFQVQEARIREVQGSAKLAGNPIAAALTPDGQEKNR